MALGLSSFACNGPTEGGSTEGGSESESETETGTTSASATATSEGSATSTTAGSASATGTTGTTSETSETSATTSVSTSATTSASSTTGETSTTGEPPVYECEDPTPIVQLGSDEPSGFETCADGLVHRVEPVTCLEPQGIGSCMAPGGTCEDDLDCTDKPYGVCNEDAGGFAGCSCSYGCETDADCADGQVCACPGVVGEHAKCIPAACDADAACDEGGLCALATDMGICGELLAEVACIYADAECHADVDCPEAPCFEGGMDMLQHICWPQDEGWSCKAPEWCGGDCGRPLLIDGEMRTAAARPGEAWLPRLTLARARDVTALAPSRARALAEHWTRAALLEHASIASFARFALQLQSLGAPSYLVSETRRAMADELLHARLCFALAGRYGDQALEPGALPLAGAAPCPLAPTDIVTALIHEACIGETLAAVLACEAAARAEDVEVVRALSRIERDELRHATLGWRALQWVIERGAAPLRRFALAELERAIAIARDAPALPGAAVDPALQAHGLLDAATADIVRRRAVRELVEPCARALRAAAGRRVA